MWICGISNQTWKGETSIMHCCICSCSWTETCFVMLQQGARARERWRIAAHSVIHVHCCFCFRLNMEMLDPLTDVETPNESDDENFNDLNHPIFLVQNELPVGSTAPYRFLYHDDRYKKASRRKLLRMKTHARSAFARLPHILKDEKYLQHIRRIRNLYPTDGGRPYLVELIGKTICMLYNRLLVTLYTIIFMPYSPLLLFGG